MLYEYLNMYLGTKLLFEQKLTQEEMYRIFATFSINFVSNADQHSVLKLLLKVVSMNSLPMFLQVLHKTTYIHLYHPRHEKTLLHIRKHMRGNRTADQRLFRFTDRAIHHFFCHLTLCSLEEISIY